MLHKFRVKEFMKVISTQAPLQEFDSDLYFKMVEKFTVADGTRVVVTLLAGTEIEVIFE